MKMLKSQQTDGLWKNAWDGLNYNMKSIRVVAQIGKKIFLKTVWTALHENLNWKN